MNYALPLNRVSQAKEWLTITLRWLALLDMGVVLAARGSLNFLPAVALASAAILNLVLTVMVLSRTDPRPRRVFVVSLDFLVAGVVLFATAPDVFVWPGLLPFASGTLYFGLPGLLILLPVLVGFQALRFSEIASPFLSIGWSLALFIVFGFFFYFLDKALAGWLQNIQVRQNQGLRTASGDGELTTDSQARDFEKERQRLLAIQEEVRKKLARDLHDGPTQSVAALALRANIARRTLEKDGKAAEEELVKVEDLARRTTKDIRHLLFLLRPLVFESQGLLPALESLTTMVGDSYQIHITLQADPDAASRLEASQQVILFYLAEESLNVARKFATAQNVWMRLKQDGGGSALLEVEDDGRSLLDRNAQSENGVSLHQILEEMDGRAQLIGGSLEYRAGSGQGNCLTLSVPIDAASYRSADPSA